MIGNRKGAFTDVVLLPMISDLIFHRGYTIRDCMLLLAAFPSALQVIWDLGLPDVGSVWLYGSVVLNNGLYCKNLISGP